MRLTSFSVSNFRSITTAKKVPLTEYSVLVGANNEGKSNILHALAFGMEVIEDFKNSIRRDSLGRIIRTSPGILGSRSRYNWSRDYPLSKQAKGGASAGTEVIFEFTLSDDEVATFQKEVGSKLNGTLPVLVFLGKNDRSITIPKQGRGGTALNGKANKVADFVSRNVSFSYIPAIRTSTSAEDVISELLSKELSILEDNADYQEAIDKIKQLQEPILNSLSESVGATVSSFLPSVKSVAIKMGRESRFRALRRGLDIEVDDGNKTPLDRKGDGVKSLVALALMQHVSSLSSGTGASIVAIEEPEAHLHPRAIHELRDVLVGLSDKNQIILTSHSPLFVNPAKLESTIVVGNSKAGVAEDISEIRESLGVRLSDNLQAARLVAIVEGEDDVILLTAILQERYPELAISLNSGDLAFDYLGGAGNLSYKTSVYKSSAVMIQCFLDNDLAGIGAVKKALDNNFIREADYNLIKIPGLKESELEDALDAKKYRNAFLSEFGVDPTIKHPAATGRKWSDAMEKRFDAHGKLWNDYVEMKVKLWLAKYAAQNPEQIVVESRFGPIDAFAKSLIKKLKLS